MIRTRRHPLGLSLTIVFCSALFWLTYLLRPKLLCRKSTQHYDWPNCGHEITTYPYRKVETESDKELQCRAINWGGPELTQLQANPSPNVALNAALWSVLHNSVPSHLALSSRHTLKRATVKSNLLLSALIPSAFSTLKDHHYRESLDTWREDRTGLR